MRLFLCALLFLQDGLKRWIKITRLICQNGQKVIKYPFFAIKVTNN